MNAIPSFCTHLPRQPGKQTPKRRLFFSLIDCYLPNTSINSPVGRSVMSIYRFYRLRLVPVGRLISVQLEDCTESIYIGISKEYGLGLAASQQVIIYEPVAVGLSSWQRVCLHSRSTRSSNAVNAALFDSRPAGTNGNLKLYSRSG